jgi:hypothetical protein
MDIQACIPCQCGVTVNEGNYLQHISTLGHVEGIRRR